MQDIYAFYIGTYYIFIYILALLSGLIRLLPPKVTSSGSKVELELSYFCDSNSKTLVMNSNEKGDIACFAK